MVFQYNTIDQQLRVGLESLRCPLDTDSRQKLIQFLLFLQKWNRSFNLTAVTDLEQMIHYHVLDSLAAAPFITGNEILDVGSGAGFPGIPLSIYFPQKHWTLLDSNGKKTRFLTQVKSEFQLHNVTVHQARAENWQEPKKFDTLIVRAVGSVQDIIEKTKHLLKPQGRWLFMKGEDFQDELTGLQPLKIEIHNISIPGIKKKRHLIIIE